MRHWIIVGLAVLAMAQTKTPPPPSGTLISKCTVDCGGTTGGTTKGGSTLPPPVHIEDSGIAADVRGNEGTEYLQTATTQTISKAMPNAVINGVPLLTVGGVSLTDRLLNLENAVAGHDSPNDFFTLRLFHMPPQQIDGRTVQICEHDDRWGINLCRTFTAVGPEALDLVDTVWVDDAAPFAPQNSLTIMSASYMPFTRDPAQYVKGIPALGAPEQWVRWFPPYPGGTALALTDVPLVVDPAPAQTWGYATTYKANLANVDYPKLTRRGWCGILTEQNVVVQMMFAENDDPTATTVPTLFEFKTKQDPTTGQWAGDPAWDFQHRIVPVVAGQVYTFKERFAVRAVSPDPLGDCDAADAAWRAQ